MKAMPDTTAEEAWTTSEERMKELIANAWDAVKRLTLQVPTFALTVSAETNPVFTCCLQVISSRSDNTGNIQ